MSKEIQLTQGKVAIVDDDMFDFLSQWKWFYAKSSSRQGTGYARRWEPSGGKRRLVNMHRVVLNAPEDLVVDHIDHDGLNNLRENLRLATVGENNRNARPHADGISKYKGVHYCNTRQRWNAAIKHDGARINLGYFDTELDAATAYNRAALRLHGEFSLLNDLDVHQEPDVFVKAKRPTPPRTSLLRGVYFAKDRSKWRATIVLGGKKVNLGTFATEKDAIAARHEAEESIRDA